jgi:ABC-type Fe3+ transport system substrate-binding protein
MRYAFAILFLLVLFTPIVMRWFIGGADAAPVPAGTQVLTIISAHPEPIRREYQEAFSAWHQQNFGEPIKINYLSFGTAEAQRVLESRNKSFAQTGSYDIDLIWGGGDTAFDRNFKPFLQGVALPPEMIKQVFPQPALAGLRLYDASDPPLWYGTALSSFGIGFNRDVLQYLGLEPPKTWKDLADPRYRGWIVLADPTKSGSARQAFMAIVERAMADAVEQGRTADEGWARGMGLIRQIAANARSFNDSAGALPGIISSGDVAAGMTIDFFARSQIQAVGDARMGYVEPANATIINPDPIGMVKGSRHAEVAKRFIEFLLSEQGQRLWNYKPGTPGGPRLTALRRLPVRRDVYNDLSNFTDPVNPFEQTSTFNTSRSRTATFGILGDLIQASCIDNLEELRATRQAILESPQAAKLDALLGTFEYDQQTALALANAYSKASGIEKLEMMRKWTQAFRDRYVELRAMAERSH